MALKGLNEIQQEQFLESLKLSGNWLNSITVPSSETPSDFKDLSKFDIVIASFPYEDGILRDPLIKRMELTHLGPDSLRRFLPIAGTITNPNLTPDTLASLASMKIVDVGHVIYVDTGFKKKFKLTQNTVSLEQRLSDLSEKYSKLLESTSTLNKKSLFLCLSSSRESIYALIETTLLLNSSSEPLKNPTNKLRLFILSDTMDLRGFYEGSNIHAGCAIKKLLHTYPILSTGGSLEIIYVGLDRNQLLEDDEEFYQNNPEVFKGRYFDDEFDKFRQDYLEGDALNQGEFKLGLAINFECIKLG